MHEQQSTEKREGRKEGRKEEDEEEIASPPLHMMRTLPFHRRRRLSREDSTPSQLNHLAYQTLPIERQ